MEIDKFIKAVRDSYRTPETTLELAKKRLEVCFTCPQKAEAPYEYLRMFSYSHGIVNSFKCNACGCSIGAKILTPIDAVAVEGAPKPGCPESKWDSII
jgi:predicted  nucleic acid-binding Zn-ribbon protein